MSIATQQEKGLSFKQHDDIDDDYGDIGPDVAPNEAKVIITLTREEEGIDGYIETSEGLDFDPGDIADFPGRDLLRLAAEMVLAAAGYDENQVQQFLDTAPRGPVQLYEAEE